MYIYLWLWHTCASRSRERTRRAASVCPAARERPAFLISSEGTRAGSASEFTSNARRGRLAIPRILKSYLGPRLIPVRSVLEIPRRGGGGGPVSVGARWPGRYAARAKALKRRLAWPGLEADARGRKSRRFSRYGFCSLLAAQFSFLEKGERRLALTHTLAPRNARISPQACQRQ